MAAVALLLLASPLLLAFAQANFTVTYRVERTEAQRVELAGNVRNVGGIDAVDVYVTAEALDASGKVLARGIAFVAASLPARGEADFSARVPNVPGTTSFRVGVSNFRVGLRRSESP